jgi:uncharacterized protein YhdP
MTDRLARLEPLLASGGQPGWDEHTMPAVEDEIAAFDADDWAALAKVCSARPSNWQSALCYSLEIAAGVPEAADILLRLLRTGDRDVQVMAMDALRNVDAATIRAGGDDILAILRAQATGGTGIAQSVAREVLAKLG